MSCYDDILFFWLIREDCLGKRFTTIKNKNLSNENTAKVKKRIALIKSDKIKLNKDYFY